MNIYYIELIMSSLQRSTDNCNIFGILGQKSAPHGFQLLQLISGEVIWFGLKKMEYEMIKCQ